MQVLALLGLFVPITIILFYFIFSKELIEFVNYDDIVYFKLFDNDDSFNKNLFCSAGKFLFIFNIQYFFLGHLKFLKHKTQNQQAKVLLRSFYAPLFVSSTVCWIGYICYGKYTPHILL